MTDNTLLLSVGDKTQIVEVLAAHTERGMRKEGRKEEGRNFNLLQPQPIPSYAQRRF
jgi:hypothetical protein